MSATRRTARALAKGRKGGGGAGKKKSVPRRPPDDPAEKKAPVRRAGSGPRLKVVRGKAAKAPPRPERRATVTSAPGASPKQRILFELVRARAAVHAAIQGVIAGVAEQPLGEGKWNTREMVLHLCARDRVRLREFEAMLRGTPASWFGVEGEAMDRINAEDLAALSHLAWDDSVRLLSATRQMLMEAVEGVPEQPADVWSPEHPFGWMLNGLPPHDRHHAEIIKRWRAEAGA